ncbi:TRAP transporter substrate-binding protein [Thermodesulfobacteriota bacterium]
MEKRKPFSLTWSLVIIFTLVAFFTVSAHQALASGKKPIELSFAMTIPMKAAPYHSAFLPWSKEIEKRTNGQVKFKFYPSQTLVKARDSYDAVVNGIADMSWAAHSLTPKRFPLTSVMELPFLSTNTFAGSYTAQDLYKKFPQIQAEHNDVHLLFFWVTLPYEVHTVKKPVKTPADMKGMKLATQPGARAALQGLGSSPVTMPSPKIYQAVEKGVADGSALAWGAYKAWKIYEVTKYHINPHLGGLPYWTAMNKNRWNSLPKDVQKVFTEVTAEMMPRTLCEAVTKEGKKGMAISLDRGQEIIDLSPADLAKWAATGKPAWDKWVKDMKAKGLPGQAVLDEAVTLIKKYNK